MRVKKFNKRKKVPSSIKTTTPPRLSAKKEKKAPLKAIIRGFSYAIVPINWNGRESGVSKYHIREVSRKYFFSILFVWLEKILLKEEIGKPEQPGRSGNRGPKNS